MTLKERASCINTIELLKRMAFNVHGLMDVVDAENCDKIIKMLNDDKSHWTPCSERLPEANGRYFVTRGLNACGAMWNRVYIINYSDLMGLKSERIWWGGNVGKSDFERFDDVIAWMPLPESYGGESDED